MQGPRKWAIKDIDSGAIIYTDYVNVIRGHTYNYGLRLRLPVNHVLALEAYSLDEEDTLPPPKRLDDKP
jgi:hypothetical protein